jgi:hypothetical protein
MRTKKNFAILVLVISLAGWVSAALPPGWYESSTSGSASYNEATDTWTVVGRESSPHYVYKSLNGDGEIIACVINGSASAGLEIREDLPSTSKYASVFIDYSFLYESKCVTFNSSQEVPIEYLLNVEDESDPDPHYWLKMERRGNTFTGYVSGYGVYWEQVGSVVISMNADVLIGIVAKDIVEFDNVTVFGDTSSDTGWIVSGNNMFSLLTGNTGIGTTSPEAKLHLAGGITDTYIDVNDRSGLGTSEIYFREHIFCGGKIKYDASNDVFQMLTVAQWEEKLGISIARGSGNVGIGTTSPQGKLDVNGSIYQRGSQLHADYVFGPNYELESIDEHSQFMWANGHLKAIPKAMLDAAGQEIIEVGAHRKGIVEELEKAHIYIEQLHKRIVTLEEKLAKIEAGQTAEQ